MRRLLFILLTGFWMGAAFPAIAADVEVSSPPGTLEELDRQLAAAFVDGQIPGAAVALIEKGRIVFTKGYGLADKAQGTPVVPDTVFRAASISKSLTGIAVMVAVQEGKVSLDGRLQGLAPEVGFQNPWESSDPVRLVHLLEHTTGWPDISLRVLTADGKGWALQRGVQAASPEFVSRWKPGRFAVYNNAGPAVAGLVLEKVTGREFNIYVRERVLRPMGMATGDFDLTPELAARLAKSYDAGGRETPFQHIILPPAGSLNVSVKELAQLVLFFLGRGTVDGTGILTPESVARIERSESTLASRVGLAAGGYGLGNAPLPDRGVTFRGHNGGIDSFTSLYGYSLQNDSGYVLMANGGEGVDFARPVSRLVQDYLTRDSPSRKAPAVAMDRKALEGHAGLYRSITPSNTLTRPYQEVLGLRLVRAGDGRLVVGGNDYFPTSEHTFQRRSRCPEPGVRRRRGANIHDVGLQCGSERAALARGSHRRGAGAPGAGRRDRACDVAGLADRPGARTTRRTRRRARALPAAPGSRRARGHVRAPARLPGFGQHRRRRSAGAAWAVLLRHLLVQHPLPVAGRARPLAGPARE